VKITARQPATRKRLHGQSAIRGPKIRLMVGHCIYTVPDNLCPGNALLHRREHYLPRGLGEFKGDLRLQMVICNDCNAHFGKLEDVLLHDSPEAFFRQMLGKFGRSGRGRKKDIFYEPTAGITPLSIIAKQSGHEHPMLWELMSATSVALMKQLVFKDDDGKYFHLPFRAASFSLSGVEKLLAAAIPALKNPRLVVYLANDLEAQQIEDICKKFLKAKPSIRDLTTGDELACEMWAPISIPYMRAIAKIAFHFFLTWFPQFSGEEREFDGIKRFIYRGGEDYAQFVSPLKEPFAKLPAGRRLKMWGHLISCQYDYQTVEARIQFFAGPLQEQPIVWSVKVGKSPSRVIASGYKCLHFRYYKTKTDGYDGEIVELDPSLIQMG
jgi:hypothetical protein